MGGPTVQKRNPEMVELLTPDFQKRNEPNFALSRLLSTFGCIPSLRGLWIPGASVSASADIPDYSGAGLNELPLADGATAPTINLRGLMPYRGFDGSSDLFTITDRADLDITGIESWVDSSLQGITLGGWFYLNSTRHGTAETLMSKWNGAANFSYILYKDASDDLRMAISNTGAGAFDFSGSEPVDDNEDDWGWYIGRWSATNKSVTVDKSHNTVASTQASIFSGGANFYVMCEDGASNFTLGNWALGFLAAAYLPDYMLDNLYEQSRVLFGK